MSALIADYAYSFYITDLFLPATYLKELQYIPISSKFTTTNMNIVGKISFSM